MDTAYSQARLPGTDPPDSPRSDAGKDTYRNRELRRLGLRIHPTGIALIMPGEPAMGLTCKDCANCVRSPTEGARRHYKCLLARPGWTKGRATDVLLRWPACERFRVRGGASDVEASPGPG